jgi:hypothetical protein
MITNPHRRNRIKQFMDKNHAAMDSYYELMDQQLSKAVIKRQKNFLRNL